MLAYFSKLFKKPKRVVAIVHLDGNVEIFDQKTVKSHPIYDYLNDDLSIFGLKGDVQIKEVDIYDGQLGDIKQKLYSVSYSQDKRPFPHISMPKEVYNVIWNFLEGDESKKKIKLSVS